LHLTCPNGRNYPFGRLVQAGTGCHGPQRGSGATEGKAEEKDHAPRRRSILSLPKGIARARNAPPEPTRAPGYFDGRPGALPLQTRKPCALAKALRTLPAMFSSISPEPV